MPTTAKANPTRQLPRRIVLSSNSRTTRMWTTPTYVKGLANFNGEISLLSSIGGQDPSERDPQAPQEAFNASRNW